MWSSRSPTLLRPRARTFFRPSQTSVLANHLRGCDEDSLAAAYTADALGFALRADAIGVYASNAGLQWIYFTLLFCGQLPLEQSNSLRRILHSQISARDFAI
uniref:Uncharacterized protein n=1 Tax=Schistocephalus solidus TaxID=70667 RepID=A0A0X3PDL2_SCHSO